MIRFRKLLVVFLTLAMLALSGCGLRSEREPDMYAMMDAIASSDCDAAAALVHPSQDVDEFLSQFPAICRVVEGRGTDSLVLSECKVTDRGMKDGISTRESGIYWGILDDGDVFTLSYVYIEDEAGAGFTVFHLVFQQP